MTTETETAPFPPPVAALIARLTEVETRWRSEPDAEVRAAHYLEDVGIMFAGLEMQSQTVDRVGKLNDAHAATIRELNALIELTNTLTASGPTKTANRANRRGMRVVRP